MKAAERPILEAGAKWFDVELDDHAIDRMVRFLELLTVWNARVRLTSGRDRRVLTEKHVVDSFAVVPELPASGKVFDVGSGAGFPGIILGCVRPDLPLTLIESRRRKANFLREAVRSIPLPAAAVLELRAEDAPDAGLAADGALVVARAVRLDAFLALAAPLLAPDGKIVAMQTPRTAGLAESSASPHDLRLARRHDYTLPFGDARTLLTFVHE
jgi:16S rRNA (guanine527-N7)-methyltransferase